MKTPYAQKTVKRSASSGVFAKRYANLNPANYNLGGSYQSYATSGTSSGTSSGFDPWGFASSTTNGVFSWLTGKQNAQTTLSNNAAQTALSGEETKRTRIVVVGIVAVLLVIGAIMIIRKK